MNGVGERVRMPERQIRDEKRKKDLGKMRRWRKEEEKKDGRENHKLERVC